MDGRPENEQDGQLTTAELILEEAAELFAQKGFAATSIREIAEAAGVTKPTLYYHFENKDGLIREIVAACMGAFRAEFDDGAEADEGPLRDELEAFTAGIIGFAKTHPAMVRLVCRLQNHAPREILHDLEAVWERDAARMAARFERAIERGELTSRDPRLLVHIFFGGVLSAVDAGLRGAMPLRPAHHLAPEIVGALFDGFAPNLKDSP